MHASKFEYLLLSFGNTRRRADHSVPSWVPNLTQITEELQTISFDNALIETETGICPSLKSDFYFRFFWEITDVERTTILGCIQNYEHR